MSNKVYLYNYCCFRTVFYKCTAYLIFFVLYLLLSSASYAQSTGSGNSSVTATTENTTPQLQGFPAGSLVLMADGTEKRIENIELGELVAAYDPVLEDYVITEVTNKQVYQAQVQSIASVMLILEELSVSLQMSGGLAGVNLEACANNEVLTKNGPKPIRQLTGDDLLYCYDEAARRFLTFRVYEVRMNSSEAKATYSLQTEHKNCIINSTVVMQREDL
jgi:hypothetical protein